MRHDREFDPGQMLANVRFGSKVDIGGRPRHVRFTSESGHGSTPDGYAPQANPFRYMRHATSLALESVKLRQVCAQLGQCGCFGAHLLERS